MKRYSNLILNISTLFSVQYFNFIHEISTVISMQKKEKKNKTKPSSSDLFFLLPGA